MINPNEMFSGLASISAPQEQMALQSQDQLKNITRANTQALSGLRQLYGMQTDAPQLNFGVSANSLGEGLAQGLGNAVNNLIAMRNYGQQARASRDLAAQYQAERQRAFDLAQAQEQEQQAQEANQYRTLSEKSPQLAQSYAYSDREGRKKLWGDITAKDLGLTYTPLEGTAEGQKQVNRGQAINAAVAQMSPIELGGVPQPGRIDDVRQIRGIVPTTSLDIKKDYLANQQADVNLQKSRNELGAQPEQIKQDLAKNALQIAQDKVNLKYTDALKQIDLLTGQGKLQEAQDAKSHLTEGQTRYNQALSIYGNMTNGQIKLFNSQMKSLKLPYELPEKPELKAATSKGKVQQFYNPETGEVFKPKKAQ